MIEFLSSWWSFTGNLVNIGLALLVFILLVSMFWDWVKDKIRYKRRKKK